MGSKWTPYFFLLPAAAYIFIFQAIPLAQQVYLSFTRTSLLNPSGGTWVGLDNYARIFGSPDFQKTLWTTLVYVVACVVGTVGLGFAVALLLNAKLPGRGIARAVVTIPWAAPGIATALIATWMMNPQYGIVTRALRAVGVDVGPSGVLDNPQLALPAILATTMWQLFPFVAVVILSALQAVPVELKEAAQLDRANRWWVFRVVTWQVVKPTVGLVALLMTIWSLRRFELIWLMTRGGPLGSTRTLVIDLYSKAFDAQRLGDAAAIGMVGIAMALIVVVGSRAVSRAAERGASS
ncbi:carbohydrate ABC transporter permease [Tessaracoccus sp. ZS01]|uniref:carbohydrate ABC transporter permease n=1 Tax=Tessaracoccus sp. ZS01 TaxID=1906324 RepID=UPI0018E9EE73|nr:sugar ABC transporter permease [Tessaracoccus sp. ZS01]